MLRAAEDSVPARWEPQWKAGKKERERRSYRNKEKKRGREKWKSECVREGCDVLIAVKAASSGLQAVLSDHSENDLWEYDIRSIDLHVPISDIVKHRYDFIMHCCCPFAPHSCLECRD